MQEQAHKVMTLSEVEPRVKEHGQQFVGAKGSLQGAVAAVVSELLSEDKYTHAGLRLCQDILIMVLSSFFCCQISDVGPHRTHRQKQIL